ncbi:MAG: gamma-glutamylcyclotransferase [Burkholderiaceae bacterium]
MDASNFAAAEPAAAYLSPSELDASLHNMLSRWDGSAPVWIFGYGSLIWHPEVQYDIKTRAIVYGFHRSLCLWSREYRGTPERPGLVLGLEPGGSCRGVAFRIPAEIAREELKVLWLREMRTGSYTPRWLDVRATTEGVQQRFRALSFVMNRHAPEYAGELDRTTLIETLRTARGRRGTSAEYLLATVRTLTEYGIHDRHLAELADEVGLTLFDPRKLSV